MKQGKNVVEHRSYISSIMDLIGPEWRELYAHELE